MDGQIDGVRPSTDGAVERGGEGRRRGRCGGESQTRFGFESICRREDDEALVLLSNGNVFGSLHFCFACIDLLHLSLPLVFVFVFRLSSLSFPLLIFFFLPSSSPSLSKIIYGQLCSPFCSL